MTEVKPLARTEEDIKRYAKAKIDFIIPHDVGPDQLKSLTKAAEKATGKKFDQNITYQPLGSGHGLPTGAPQRQMQQQLTERTRLTHKSLLDFTAKGMQVPRAIVTAAKKLIPGLNNTLANNPQQRVQPKRRLNGPTLH